jgi:hypothetical protein
MKSLSLDNDLLAFFGLGFKVIFALFELLRFLAFLKGNKGEP